MLISNKIEHARMIGHIGHVPRKNPRSKQPIFFFQRSLDEVELSLSSSSINF